nr:uncharacterized protein LOC116427353 [Nomia melanderi]
MSESDKVYMKLSFNQRLSYSQRQKVKEFWRFLDSETHLKPYTVSADKDRTEKLDNGKHAPELPKTMWRQQLRLFREHGLDKAALTGTEVCKLCSVEATDRCSEFADTVEQPYEELMNDVKTFEDKLTTIK